MKTQVPTNDRIEKQVNKEEIMNTSVDINPEIKWITLPGDAFPQAVKK